MAEIIYISNPLFTDNKTSSHHIVWELVKKNRVLYLESGGMRMPEISQNDLCKIIWRLGSLFKPPQKIKKNLYLYKLINLPLHGSRAVQKLNKLFTLTLIKTWKRYLHINEPILWIFPPDYGMLINHLEEKKSVYYCTDDYCLMPGVDADSLRNMEKKLLTKVDVAFFTSKKLCEKKKHLTRNPIYSPHAVDYNHFAKAQHAALQIPKDISNLKQPIIGFVGLVEKWLDIDLIKYLVTNKKEWNFIFIGRVAANIASLKSFQNIRFLGFRPYEKIPSYLSKFNVCIIPFKKNQLADCINPIKLKEYLSSGKPVVSTYMPELENYKDLIGIGHTKKEFLGLIDYFLKNDCEQLKNTRINAVFSDSWEARVKSIMNKIENIKQNPNLNKKLIL